MITRSFLNHFHLSLDYHTNFLRTTVSETKSSHLKIGDWKMIFLLERLPYRYHVGFREGIVWSLKLKTCEPKCCHFQPFPPSRSCPEGVGPEISVALIVQSLFFVYLFVEFEQLLIPWWFFQDYLNFFLKSLKKNIMVFFLRQEKDGAKRLSVSLKANVGQRFF